MKRYILTGMPGCGKTSVIKQLEAMGYQVIHEAATDIIAQEQAKGIERPWEGPDFIDKITHMQKQRQMNAVGDLQFYDRSPMCTYALALYLRFEPSLYLMKEIEHNPNNV